MAGARGFVNHYFTVSKDSALTSGVSANTMAGIDKGKTMHNLRSLVLNSAYEPLQFTSARRALVLVLLGKAEPLEKDGFFARTVTASYRLPVVIRLNRYVRKPGRFGVAFSRKNVLRRDDHTCQYCGARDKELTIDHVTPRSSGGESVWDNVVTACRVCNLKKGNKSLGLSGLVLKRKPVRPRFLIYPSSAQGSHPASHIKSWTKYLSSSLSDLGIVARKSPV